MQGVLEKVLKKSEVHLSDQELAGPHNFVWYQLWLPRKNTSSHPSERQYE